MNGILEKGTDFVMRHARLLDRAIFEYKIYSISPSRVINSLHAYQNPDGGFGHALEPDLRCPNSQPLYLEFALRTLYECDLHDAALISRSLEFTKRHADLTTGIPTIFSTSRCFPRAPHWENPTSEQPGMERLVSIVGLLSWLGVQDDWLGQAEESSLNYISTNKIEDAHILQNAFCLIESVGKNRDVNHLYKKLQLELLKANFFILETPVDGYGMTPLNFAFSPDSFCRKLFTEEQINAHLNNLMAKQQADGGWEIEWNPPGQSAYWEWRGYRTVQALSVLKAYDRL